MALLSDRRRAALRLRPCRRPLTSAFQGTPDVFKLKGSDNAWTPFGSVDPSTHVFAPATNGSIAPNDCLKWAWHHQRRHGVRKRRVVAAAQPADNLHLAFGLVNNVTTPTEAWTVQQQGFYAPGDGGAATYQWNFTS